MITTHIIHTVCMIYLLVLFGENYIIFVTLKIF